MTLLEVAAPARDRLKIGVIGAGRVGAVLAAALREAGHEIVAVAGESDASRARIADLLPDVPVRKPTAVARAAELLLLTVPDDMLANVVATLAGAGALDGPRRGAPDTIPRGSRDTSWSVKSVVHTSGRHGLGVLGPATERGAIALALHPAMTFTGTATDLPRMAGCSFGATAANPPAAALAEHLVGDLRGRLLTVPEELRAVYHASLTHGANHLVTLVTQAMGLLSDAGAEDPAATLRPLLTAALDNALALGDAALTGPIVRGDVETVRAHLTGVAATRPDTLPSYVTMARATVNVAVLDGRLLPRRAATLVGLLNDALAPPSLTRR